MILAVIGDDLGLRNVPGFAGAAEDFGCEWIEDWAKECEDISEFLAKYAAFDEYCERRDRPSCARASLSGRLRAMLSQNFLQFLFDVGRWKQRPTIKAGLSST